MSFATTVERQMLDLINAARAEVGLHALKLALDLNESAEDHSSWMLQTDTFSHTGAGGSSAGDRMKQAGFDFSGGWSWGENIAWQSERGSSGIADDVADLFNSLMNSPGHKANILSPGFDYVGIGVETGNYAGWNAVMVTQNFASTGGSVDLDTGGTDTIVARAGAGNDVVRGTNGADELYGYGGMDILKGLQGNDRLKGGAGADTLLGNQGSDVLKGGSQDDTLNGGQGRDQLRGNDGRDTLNGGGGNDILFGGKGADTFEFGSGGGQDRVRDFRNDVDTIRLDDALWSGSLTGAEVVRAFASVEKGNVVFDFGKATLVIEGVDNPAGLIDDLIIV